ncbi:cytochrome C [Dokdonella sp.]|uniref:cytochrome C n=1 Tax=Dokdonella sp. TaxID=2291710 RepID=UPI002F40346F
MNKLVIALAVLLGTSAAVATLAAASRNDLVQRGRYVVLIGGCNDCHTPGFTANAGKVPESQWLTGDDLGWSGPWGTTYAPNLRLRLATMDSASFKRYAHAFTARPPMPYWAVNAMSDADLDALYAFVQSLGPAGKEAPSALPPGIVPPGPVVQFPAPPESVAAH